MEKKGLVTLAELEYLDADPFLLFGIEHPATQKALKRLQKEPILKCEGDTPSENPRGGRIAQTSFRSRRGMDELPLHGPNRWCSLQVLLRCQYTQYSSYVHRWVIEAFAEVELTLPWTSYKGIGSIVCFTNSDTKVGKSRFPFRLIV